MYKRTIVASLAASLIAVASPAFAQLKAPDGMVWKSADGKCAMGGGEIEGCAFGPASSKRRTGLAYFRVCGQIVEAHPFLIVDLTHRKAMLYVRHGKAPEVLPFKIGTTKLSPQEVTDMAATLEPKRVCLAV